MSNKNSFSRKKPQETMVERRLLLKLPQDLLPNATLQESKLLHLRIWVMIQRFHQIMKFWQMLVKIFWRLFVKILVLTSSRQNRYLWKKNPILPKSLQPSRTNFKLRASLSGAQIKSIRSSTQNIWNKKRVFMGHKINFKMKIQNNIKIKKTQSQTTLRIHLWSWERFKESLLKPNSRSQSLSKKSSTP